MGIADSTLTELASAGLDVERDVPLRKRSWWRAGGPADAMAEVSTLAQLCAVQRICGASGTPLTVLGNASNLLISERGVRGLVIRLSGELARCELDATDPSRLHCGAGLKLPVLQSRMLKQGWCGLESIAGVPGTIGGAVRMNAGTVLGEIKDHLESVQVVLPDGERVTLPVSALQMSYRTCVLPEGAIVAAATFQLPDEDPDEMRAQVEHHLERRRQTQPINQPSCGSTWRNPPGDHAGRLVEASGLKGYRVGDAQVSEKHANFIVNLGEASADDLAAVLAHVEATVRADHGVTLVREVHLIGDW